VRFDLAQDPFRGGPTFSVSGLVAGGHRRLPSAVLPPSRRRGHARHRLRSTGARRAVGDCRRGARSTRLTRTLPPSRGSDGSGASGAVPAGQRRRCRIRACIKPRGHHVPPTQAPSTATRPDVAYCGAHGIEGHDLAALVALASTSRTRGRLGPLGRKHTSETRCRLGGRGSLHFISAMCGAVMIQSLLAAPAQEQAAAASCMATAESQVAFVTSPVVALWPYGARASVGIGLASGLVRSVPPAARI
jgi:hypothetical protein